MASMKSIRSLSGLLRYLVIAGGLLISAAVIFTVMAGDSPLITLGDDRLADLLASPEQTGAWLLLVPTGLVFLLAVYWLQRLFHAYHQGRFFDDEALLCCQWLVWLKAAVFMYHLLLPVFMSPFIGNADTIDQTIAIDVAGLSELVVLVLIVHILKRAQAIQTENERFV